MALAPFPKPPPTPDPLPPGPRDDAASEVEPFDDAASEVEPFDETDGASGKMSFLDHLDELRKRLVIALISIVVGILIAFAFIPFIFEFIMRPLQEILPESGRLVYTEPTEAFFLYMKMAALAGLLIAFPVVAAQIWFFTAPGLYAREKRFAIPFVAMATFFFTGGAFFAHFLLFPWAWGFFAGFATDYMEFLPRIQPAFSLYVKLVLACGLMFQLPTAVFFLSRVGAVTPQFLIRNIKYAILLIFIVSAILTPTGDPVTLTMMAAPMTVLYGLSILIAWIFGKKPTEDEE